LRAAPVVFATTVAAAARLSAGFIESGEAILPNHFSKVGVLFYRFFNQELVDVFNLNPLFVFLDDFFHRVDAHGERRFAWLTFVGEEHNTLKNIGLEMRCRTLWQSQSRVDRREVTKRFNILIQLKVEAAFQLATLPCQFRWVERQLLIARCTGAYCAKIGKPAGTAKLTATAANTAQAAGFVAITDLAHVNAYTKFFRIPFYQLAEVNPVVGCIEEGGLGFIALILHVAQLHFQSQIVRDGACTHHRILLEFATILPAVNVIFGCFSKYFLNLVVVFGVFAFHLYFNQLTRKANHPYIETR
jgi:hypothetical protein